MKNLKHAVLLGRSRVSIQRINRWYNIFNVWCSIDQLVLLDVVLYKMVHLTPIQACSARDTAQILNV